MNQRVNLTGLTQPELVEFSGELGLPAYRGRQLFAALQHRRLRSFEEISDLPKELRARLSEVATASSLTVESRYVSADGTRRYLMKTHDNLPVETVFIPEERRDTICFSSQSGCPLQCTFCLTAQLGLLRSLTAGEIPRILDLARVPDRPHLAISLAAPTDELRNELMPINKKWPLEELLSACKEFEKTLRPGERFTFEYVMLRDVNDSDEHARQLANLLNRHDLRAKVNLIPHNPAEPLPYHASPLERVELFREILESKGVHAFVRKPRGRD